MLQADKSAFKAKKIGGARGKVPGGKKEQLQTEGIDFTKKIVCAEIVTFIDMSIATWQLASTGEHDCDRSNEQPVGSFLSYFM